MKLIHILTHINNFFDTSKRRQTLEEAYLNKATSVADLERRMRELERADGRMLL